MHSDYDRRSDSGYSSSTRTRDGGRGDGRGDGRGPARGRGMPLSELDPQLTATSHKVIGCARDVHMALGPGFDREAYFKALQTELTAQGIEFKANHALDVRYKGQVVGHATADLFIAGRFIVTVAAVPGEVGSYERTVLRAQLRAADVELGLIINFAGRLLKDGLVRVLNPDKLQAMRGHAEGAGGDEGYDDVIDDQGQPG